MNNFGLEVKKYITIGNTYLIKIKDMRLDFNFAITLITEYFQHLLSSAVENTCKIEIINESKYIADRVKLRISCEDEEDNAIYMVTLTKSTSIRSVRSSNGRPSMDPYEDSCTLLMSVIEMDTGEIIDNCVIMALPSHNKDYVHMPYVYLDRMLKYIFNRTTEDEKCYLYLCDTSVKNFFEFEINKERLEGVGI